MNRLFSRYGNSGLKFKDKKNYDINRFIFLYLFSKNSLIL